VRLRADVDAARLVRLPPLAEASSRPLGGHPERFCRIAVPRVTRSSSDTSATVSSLRTVSSVSCIDKILRSESEAIVAISGNARQEGARPSGRTS
jgi:hypothetical protein